MGIYTLPTKMKFFHPFSATRRYKRHQNKVKVNPQAPDEVYRNPSSLLPDGVYKHITISHTSFEQKCGNSVWVIENKWSAYGKTKLSRIHS